MPNRVEFAHAWPEEKIAPYTADLFAAIRKIEAARPDDVTAGMIAKNIIDRTQALWLILDENDKFKAFFLTTIDRLPASGKIRCVLMDCAGDAVPENLDIMEDAVLPWGKKHGATVFDIWGRPGWGRLMKDRGYKQHAVLLRMESEPHEQHHH